MPCFRRLPLFLTLSLSLLVPAISRAALIRTFDLTTLCFLSTDVVEARLTRQHSPGQEEWKDTFTATVLTPLEGIYKTGDRITRLDLTLYDPSRTGQRCLLFLTRRPQDQVWPEKNPPPVRLVDMLLVDSHGHVRRYFQWSNPGGLLAENYPISSLPDGGEEPRESKLVEQMYPTLAQERVLIVSKWAVAKKKKTPSYQVLHQTER